MHEPSERATADDRLIKDGLAYPPWTDADDFALRVMQRIGRERRRRRLVLGAFGATGAVFGLLGAGLLLQPLGALLNGLPVTGTMQAALAATAAVAFYGWFMNEDVTLTV